MSDVIAKILSVLVIVCCLLVGTFFAFASVAACQQENWEAFVKCLCIGVTTPFVIALCVTELYS